MRAEFLFNEEVTGSKENYFTEAAKWMDSMKNGVELSDGRCLQTELSEAERAELENYIMTQLMPEIEVMAKAKKRKMDMDYDKAEDFKALLIMKTYTDFYKFNNVNFLTDKEKQYTISTFLEQKAHEAMRDLMISERNFPVNVIRNLKTVNDVVLAIAKEEEIEPDAVSALMVHDKMADKSISYKMVIALMDIYHGNISIDDMDDAENRIQDNTNEIESKIGEEMDKDTKDVLDRVFMDFSQLEVYILMKEFGFLGEEMRKMTVKELSYQDYFVTLAKDDIDGKKNIEFGNVQIKRPGRNSSRVEDILIVSVYYVKEKFYSNKVAKIKKKLATLAGKIAMHDVAGCLESYCVQLWNDNYNTGSLR